MRKKLIFGALIVAGGAAIAAVVFLPQGAAPTAAGPQPGATSRAQQPGTADAERFAALPGRETVGRPAGQPFGSPRPPPPRAAAPAPVAAAPTAPPMPYRIAGQMVQGGAAQVVLAKGDRVLTVREGDTLEDGYRVEAIRPQGVTLLYVPMDIRETLPFASALGPGR